MPVRLVLAALLAFAAPQAQAQALEGRRCATPEPTISQVIESNRIVQAFASRTASLRVSVVTPVTVPVAFHILTAGSGESRGDIPQAWVEAQIDTLNATFAPFGVRFALALVERVDNADWYRDLTLGSAEERALKRTLALDPARVLNVYTAALADDYLGWASPPYSNAQSDTDQGVVLLDQSLPGGRAAPYNLGHTGTHEVGHWAGLLHTFAGGCSQPNDGVGDTPQSRSGTSGCPETRDSCPLDPGADPIHNYMDYSSDACMTEFTPGQTTRSLALLNQFRPVLVAGNFALATLPRGGFAETFVGLATASELRVTNATAAAFDVIGVTAASGALAVGVEGLPMTVAPGEVAVLSLSARPLAKGAFTETLRVATTSAAAPTLAVPVTGTAFLPPTARLQTVGVQARVIEGGLAERTVTLSNDGDGPLSFSVDLEALPASVAAVSPASGVIPPRGEVTITLSLTSAGLAPATYADPLVIETNDPLRGDVVVTVGLVILARPTALVVRPVFPNPTRGAVTIPLELPDDAVIRAEVYDARGRRVAVLADGTPLEAGYPELRWDASGVPSGVYVVRVLSSTEAAVGRIVVTR